MKQDNIQLAEIEARMTDELKGVVSRNCRFSVSVQSIKSARFSYRVVLGYVLIREIFTTQNYVCYAMGLSEAELNLVRQLALNYLEAAVICDYLNNYS